MQQVPYIPDIFRAIVSRVSSVMLPTLQGIDPSITAVHFLTGHYTEIKNRLQAKTNSISYTNTKYPLICLFQDFVEDKRADGFYASLSLQLIIIHYTAKEDYVEDRRDKVFLPILYPIYDEFLNQLVQSGKFQLFDAADIPHKKIDRPHWGNPAQYGNNGYILGDIVDGVEIKDLSLKMFSQNFCS